MDSIVSTYEARTPASGARARDRALLFPGADFRASTSFLPYGLTLAKGEGPWIEDVDGNRYLDLIANHSVLVHGHAYPPIVEAAQRAVAAGASWSGANDHIDTLAEQFITRIASVERVRLVNSGTEATILAVKMARELTGRRKILMARYGYHGIYDLTEVGSAGVGGPDTFIADFGEAASFAEVLDREGADIACVIIEPTMTSGGIVTAPPGFLSEVADAARAAGALFILDEVVTSRLAVGGAQSLHGVTPDLSTFGKTIGGGFPAGAVGGRGDLVDVLDPAKGRLPMGGTFHGNPVTAAAGTVALRDLTAERIDDLNRWCASFAAGLERLGAEHGVPLRCRVAGSMMNVYLTEELPAAHLRPDQNVRADAGLMAAFHLASLNHGLFFATRGWIAMHTALSDELIAQALDRASAALADVARTSLVGSAS